MVLPISPSPYSKPQRDVGPVDLGVDVERLHGARGTGFASVPLLLDAIPHRDPVAGLFLRPCQDVPHHARIGASGGHAGEAGFDDPARVVFEVGGRVHAGHEHPAVDAVAVVHDPPDTERDVVRGLREPRRHHADEVGFDLKIDVVGVGVVLGGSGECRRNATLQGSPRREVGVPEAVAGLAEDRAEVLGGRVQPFVVEHLGEGHVDVEVVLAQRVCDPVRLPGGQLVLRKNRVHGTELGGRSEADADHLARPAAFDLVAEVGEGYLPPGGGRPHQESCHRNGTQHNSSIHENLTRYRSYTEPQAANGTEPGSAFRLT